MSLLENHTEIPRRIPKTILKLDEAIAMLIYLLVIVWAESFAEPWATTYLSIASSVFLIYAIKCIKFEKVLLLCGLLFCIGLLAKLEHWWWASYVLIISMMVSILTLIYIGIRKRKRWDQRIFLIAIIIYIMANQAKLEHWYWAIYAYFLTAVLFCGAGIYRFYLKEDKNIYDLLKLSIIIVFPIHKIAQTEHFEHLPYISTLCYLILLFFTVLSFVDIFKNRIFTK